MSVSQNLTDYKNGDLHIDFYELTIRQNKSTDEAILYQGKGYIEQAVSGEIIFKLYANYVKNTDFINDVFIKDIISPGKFYKEENYYTLTGVDTNGITWKSDRILPGYYWNDAYEAPIVHGSLDEVTRNKSGLKKHIIRMSFLDMPESKFFKKDASFECSYYSFNILSENDSSIIVSIELGDECVSPITMRVEEALCFLFARPVRPQIIFHDGKITFFSGQKKSNNLRLFTPVSLSSRYSNDVYCKLFKAYLKYILKESNSSLWAPTSAYLRMAQESSANSAQAWAIGLGVAVEGLVELVDIGEDQYSKEQLEKFKSYVIECVSSKSEFRHLSKRIDGLVSGICNIRPVDRLKWLSDNGKVSDSNVRSWRKMRNRSVHPRISKEKTIISAELQKIVDDINCVTVLMYQIIFYLIEYQGIYTDYSKMNFPEASYP